MKRLMTSKEYHAHQAIGSSLLKKAHATSIAHALSDSFEMTDDKAIGLYTHALLLEPESVSRDFAIAPKCDRRTTAGKAIWESFCLDAESNNKEVIKQEVAEIALMIKEAVLKHAFAGDILSGGESEYSYFTKDKETGLELKCRPDYKNKGALIDLKTTQDASLDGFGKEIGKWNYHIQAAYYLDVHNAATGENLKDFFFIACEKKAPFALAVYQLSEVDIEAGREAYRATLKKYANYLKEVESIGKDAALRKNAYPEVIAMISAPYWMLDKIKVGV